MLKSLIYALVSVLTAATAFGQEGGVSQAPLPRSMASPIRIIPVLGESSFTTAQSLGNLSFNQGFSAGILGDFGSGMWTFESGLMSLNSSETRSGDTRSYTINTWGIPLLAKVNFSGQPHSTVFLKAGVMPFTASGGDNASTNFDVLGVGGIGGHVPLGRNSSILLDASYNRLFTRAGEMTDYHGIALLAGLSLNI